MIRIENVHLADSQGERLAFETLNQFRLGTVKFAIPMLRYIGLPRTSTKMR
jgi:hypothetical protein